MRKFVPNLVVLGALVLVAIIGSVAFVVAGKLAVLLDPSANESHLSSFMIAITGVAVAVGSAFPIFGRAIPWVTARLERLDPQRPPEHFTQIKPAVLANHVQRDNIEKAVSHHRLREVSDGVE